MLEVAVQETRGWRCARAAETRAAPVVVKIGGGRAGEADSEEAGTRGNSGGDGARVVAAAITARLVQRQRRRHRWWCWRS